MELLDYLDNTTFNLKSSSESEEDYQIMSKYFNQNSDNDLSYTNDTDYDYGKPPMVNGNAYTIDESNNTQQNMDYANINYFQGQQQLQKQQPPPAFPFPTYHAGTQMLQLLQQSSAEDFARSTAGKATFPDISLETSSNLMYTTSQQHAPIHHTPIQQNMQQPPQHSQLLNNTPLIQRTQFQQQPTSYSAQSTPLQGSMSTPLQQQRQAPVSPVLNLHEYPDMTTMVNSNSNMVLPMVDSAFVDHRICTVCSKRITRDMSRHMRTHQIIPRFQCTFPKLQCNHKSGRFNRPYDFKKHLLNRHFKFDDSEIKKIHNLSDKLNHEGTCPCGMRFISKDWLDEHILTNDRAKGVFV